MAFNLMPTRLITLFYIKYSSVEL